MVPSAADVAVGGHSYGGRVASLAAAEPDAPYAALVLFSYPLHPPGAPERTDARIAHWPDIRCPVLLLSGESDPFAKIDLLRASVAKLPHAELVTYPRLGHTLKPVLEDALDRAAAFLLGICRGLSRARLVCARTDSPLSRSDVGPYPDRPPGAARHDVARPNRPVHVAAPTPTAAGPQRVARVTAATRPTLDALTAPSR